MKIDGACHCGYIRVEGEADPEKTTVCHCTDCQVGTGSAFRVNVPVPGAPRNTAIRPTARFRVIGSSTSCVASSAAAIGLRPRASALPAVAPTPRE